MDELGRRKEHRVKERDDVFESNSVTCYNAVLW